MILLTNVSKFILLYESEPSYIIDRNLDKFDLYRLKSWMHGCLMVGVGPQI